LVLADHRIDWGRPDIGCHGPDLAVFEDVTKSPHPVAGTFYVKKSGGGRCVLVLEVVSPHTRKNDVEDKLREYHAVGVPFYVIVDQKKQIGPRQLMAYEWTPTEFVAVPLTAQGRVELVRLGLCLGLGEDRIVCYDTVTGEEMGDWNQLLEARRLAEQQAREAERRTQEAERQKQEAERQKQEAERQKQEETLARARAEKEAEDARRRIQELEAELRRLRGEPNSHSPGSTPS
jgi:hypothetical protein